MTLTDISTIYNNITYMNNTNLDCIQKDGFKSFHLLFPNYMQRAMQFSILFKHILYKVAKIFNYSMNTVNIMYYC